MSNFGIDSLTPERENLKVKKRVLFIDDCVADFEILKYQLREHPISIFWAPNIEKAKMMDQGLTFDLYVCDTYGVGDGHNFILDKPHILTSGVSNPTVSSDYLFVVKNDLPPTILTVLEFEED